MKIVPAYLKTPSKRSAVRAKRPELPASPEKRRILPVGGYGGGFGEGPGGGSGGGFAALRAVGAASAPPLTGGFNEGGGGVTSFERRLRERGVADRGGFNGGRGRGGGGKRVGLGGLDG